MKTKLLTVLILTSFLGIYGCEAPTGDVGPQGAAGATGEKGDKGLPGDKGALSGIVSEWKEIKSDQWKLSGLNAAFTQSEAALTQDILDRGLILAYYRPLPEDESSAVISLADETNTYLFTYKASLGSLDYELNFKKAEFVNPNLEDWNIKVRYIIVPPAKAGRMANVNWTNYNEVKKVLNLND